MMIDTLPVIPKSMIIKIAVMKWKYFLVTYVFVQITEFDLNYRKFSMQFPMVADESNTYT